MRLLIEKKRANHRTRNWFVVGFFCALFCVAPSLAQQTVLVLIHTDEKYADVSGDDLAIYSKDQKVLSSSLLKITLVGNELFVNKRKLTLPLKVKSEKAIRIQNKSFRGDVVIDTERVKDKQRLLLIHPMDLETYVAGIVASEVPASWPQEALNAQAIAARTYAVFQKYRRFDRKYHLSATVLDQVYGGLEKEHSRADLAAKETYGIVITHEMKPIQAFFHSSCGGKTASAKEEWGSELEYLPGADCGFCDDVNAKEWAIKISDTAIEKNLNKAIGSITDVKAGKRGASGRLENLQIVGSKDTLDVDASKMRAALGYGKLKSTLIDRIANEKGEFVFFGKGFGHGVGMCQWGARGMAQKGHKAESILLKYYAHTELRRMY